MPDLRPPASNHRAGRHPEKILQSRFDPGRFAGLIIDPHAAATGDRHGFRGHLVEQSPLLGVQPPPQLLDQPTASGVSRISDRRAQFGEAFQPFAQRE